MGLSLCCCCALVQTARHEQKLKLNEPFCGALNLSSIIELLKTSRSLTIDGVEIYIKNFKKKLDGFDGGRRKETADAPILGFVYDYTFNQEEGKCREELISELTELSKCEGRGSMILQNDGCKPYAIMLGLECFSRDWNHPFYFFGDWKGNYFAHRY